MQQHCGYPVFWTNQADRPPVFTHASMFPPPPFPDFRKQRRKDGTCVCLLIIFLLVFLALAGVGVGTYKLLEMQKELDQIKESSSNMLHSPSAEKLTGSPLEKKGSRQAAHVTGTKSPDLPLVWEDRRGSAFTGGIQYKNRGLVVNESGLHFLYSSIYFHKTDCPKDVLELTHIIYKKPLRYPSVIKLMENKDYHSCLSRGIWGRQSYLGAVFNLTRSDELYVNVSNVELVSSDETKTFFGLYRL